MTGGAVPRNAPARGRSTYNAMAMEDLCPVCDEPMALFELEGVQVDRCPGCRGSWLDAGELEELAERAGLARGPLGEALLHAKGDRHGSRRCVRCSSVLRVVAVEGVELDRCPHGCGLWFDAGEMTKVVSTFHAGEPGEVARFFGDLYRSDLASEPRKGG